MTTLTKTESESPADMLRRVSAPGISRSEAAEFVALATASAQARTGRGLDLTGADLSNLNLTGFDLSGAVLNRAILHGTKFNGANLRRSSLICPGMERTDFTQADLTGAYVHAIAAQVCKFDYASLNGLLDATGSLFHGCSMVQVGLVGARMAGSMFYQCNLEEARLESADLQGSTINECVLARAVFNNADVSQVTITKCNMRAAQFVSASGEGLTIQRATNADWLTLERAKLPCLRLHNVSGAKVNMSGLSAENMHVIECSFVDANMHRLSARCGVFRDCDLSDSDLTDAYLYRAMLTGDPPTSMQIVRANLTNANLVQAYIAADLSMAKMTNVKAAYARLNQSVFRDTYLDGATLYQASMVKTDFSAAHLKGVKGPFFADRCPQLEESLQLSGMDETAAFVARLKPVMSGGGST